MKEKQMVNDRISEVNELCGTIVTNDMTPLVRGMM
jgi:hypothetical protein